MNRKVYVTNLSPEAGESELKSLFSKAGNVTSVRIVKDLETGRSRGIAFVEMSTQWEAKRAASMLNRKDFMGKSLVAREAKGRPWF